MYQKLHDNKRSIVLQYFDEKELHKLIVANMSYVDILAETTFGLTPLGDNKFIYRFTKVLSAGAIPVFHGGNYGYSCMKTNFEGNKIQIYFKNNSYTKFCNKM